MRRPLAIVLRDEFREQLGFLQGFGPWTFELLE
jgi:hypothetical protein